MADGPGRPDDVVLFAPPSERRRFAPGDVVRLVSGLALVASGALVASIAQSTVEGVEADLVDAFARLPDLVESVLLDLAQIATSLVPTAVLIVLLVRRRWKIALLLVLASALASLGMELADALVIDRDLAELFAQLRAESAADATYPTSNVIASTVAVVTVAAPWLSRRWRQTLWWAVGVLVVMRLVVVAHPALDVVLAVGVGTVVGALVLLAFGSPTNEPQPQELLDALRADGFSPRRIDRSDADGSVLRYAMVDDDGGRYAVALRTPSERDADLLPRVYRGFRYRASEVGIPYSTLKRRIEHEALVLALAGQGGVRVPRVVRIGMTERGSAFLVTAAADTRAATADDLARPDLVRDVWAQVRALHDAGLAHRRLALESLRVDDDGAVWLRDFDAAQTAPDEREVARDVAALLSETALVVGADRAVEIAVDALGPARVAPALRMLQPLALPPATWVRVKPGKGVLDDLRAAVNAATGEPGLELEDLERIKPRTLVIIGASTLAFYSLLPQLANLDDTVDAFRDARYGWILGALAASAVTYVFAAVSLQGAVAAPIPFAPNLRAQVAASFAGLVGPAGAGGFALTARFLERFGVRAAEAGASVAVNAIGGFIVHATLLGGFILWAGNSTLDGFSLPSVHVVLLVIVGVLVLVGVLAAFRPVRRRVLAPMWATTKTGVSQLGRTFRNPARVAELFGGSAGISLTYVVAAACSVQAFGGGLTFPQIGAAYLGAVALASLAPTPGGLGALETALIAGYTAFGLPGGVAVSATLTFRLVTFWLPLLPGWAALGWMQRNDEV